MLYNSIGDNSSMPTIADRLGVGNPVIENTADFARSIFDSSRYQNEYQTAERLSAQDYQTRERLAKQEYDTFMSNTAYQRAVEDMKKAGLNPALMFSSGSSASSPQTTAGGSTGQAGSNSTAQTSAKIISSLATVIGAIIKIASA